MLLCLVEYEADENGYRVTNIETEPIGDGPQPKKFGTAMVQQVVSGVQTKYAIQAQPADNADSDGVEGREGGVKLVDITPDFVVDGSDQDEYYEDEETA